MMPATRGRPCGNATVAMRSGLVVKRPKEAAELEGIYSRLGRGSHQFTRL